MNFEEKADFVIQTLIFPKDKWPSKAAAKKWARDHDFKDDVDETEVSYRMRQRPPGDFERLRTICINPSRDTAMDDCKVKAVGGPLKKEREIMDKKFEFPPEIRRMKIKTVSETGEFEGMLSPYGNVDEGGDVVEPGAFAKTLAERGNKVPLLWQHRPDNPIGELELEDTDEGLWAKGKLLMELPEAKRAYLVIKHKIVKGLSIGYETIKGKVEGGVRHLKEIKLYEGSIVTFPMNEMALISAVKSRLLKGDFYEELEEGQILTGLYQMQYALSDAINSVVYNAEMTRDEKVAAGKVVVDQFADAFAEFFPKYLETMEERMKSGDATEGKEGRTLSAANVNSIKAACDKIKNGYDDLLALLGDKAGTTTLSAKAATPEPEPVEDHSAAENLSAAEAYIKALRALIPAS